MGEAATPQIRGELLVASLQTRRFVTLARSPTLFANQPDRIQSLADDVIVPSRSSLSSEAEFKIARSQEAAHMREGHRVSRHRVMATIM